GVTWASSDTSVATIDAQGRLTVRGEGVATIVATSITAPNVPYAFEIVVVRDGTSVATGVSVYCEQNTSTERRLVIPYDVSDLPFVDLRAHIDGHNITSQLVTWTSSCGAMLGSPSMFLEFSLTENGLRVTGLLQGGPFIITATPVGAIGAVGTFRIFVDQSVAAVVTSVSVSAPSVSELVVPNTRPLLTPDFPTTQLTATTVGGVGGGTNSAVVWTSSCGARAGVGIESIVGEFVYFILDGTNPNSVSVRARDRGLAGFSQAVTITATSVVTPSQFASRQITVSQGAISGIEVSAVAGGLSEGTLIIPYASSEVAGRPTIDLQALVSVSHASVSGAIRWVVCTPNVVALYNIRNTEPLTSVVTLRPLDAGVFTIWAVGVYCGVESSIFTLTIEQEGATSVRISGRNEGVFSYEMHIRLPRPDAIHLPMVELIAWVGGRPAASGVAWTSSCGGEIVEFLGSAGVLVTLRAVNAGTAIIRATNNSNGFYSTFTISVTKASLDSVEILGDGVVRQQTAMLIPLEYNDGVYTLSDVAVRQILTLSLNVATSGDVTTQFVWTISDSSVIRINGAEVCAETGEVTSSKITDIGGFVQVLPYGVGVATIRAVSTIDASFYTEFTIFVTRGTASCIIQDGILDLPQIQDGYVRIILVCEHYFGQRRMTHVDMHFADAMYYILPMLQINIEGAIFHGWSLSRGGQLLGATFVANGGSNGGSEEYNGEGYEGGYTNGGGTNGGEYVILIPMHLFDLEAGLDTLLLFAVWYIPYVPSENGGSNLARNIIIGTLSVAGVGAAGTAGYVAQSKIRARRKNDMEEWGLDN
ncbi:MAG: Ig-like domain-containing protein, partial [Firmicutes bacterium]|nr:Ig-like domain-containing protein [Bacillota bacterium]